MYMHFFITKKNFIFLQDHLPRAAPVQDQEVDQEVELEVEVKVQFRSSAATPRCCCCGDYRVL